MLYFSIMHIFKNFKKSSIRINVRLKFEKKNEIEHAR